MNLGTEVPQFSTTGGKFGRPAKKLSGNALYYDREAFDQHVPAICFKVVDRMQHLFPRVSPDDLLQECVLQVWRKRRRFRSSRAQVSTWICKVSIGRLKDMIKKSIREGRTASEYFKIHRQQGTLPEIDAQNETVTP